MLHEGGRREQVHHNQHKAAGTHQQKTSWQQRPARKRVGKERKYAP